MSRTLMNRKRIDALLALALARANSGGGGGLPPGTGIVKVTGGVGGLVAGGPGLVEISAGNVPSALSPVQAGNVVSDVGTGFQSLPVQTTPLRINSNTPTTAVFVDPANSTTHASNTNPGTALLPLLTTAFLQTAVYQKHLVGDTTLTWMSDDVSGAAFDWSTLDRAGFNLTLAGTVQTVHTGGTLNAGTVAIDPTAGAGGQSQIVHTSDVADFTPFVVPGFGGTATDGIRLVDTTGGNLGNAAWVADVRGANAATPTMTQPINAAFSGPGTLTSGDGYKLTRGSRLAIALQDLSPNTTTTFSSVTLQDFSFVSGSGGAPLMTCLRCSFVDPVPVTCVLIDCLANGGFAGDLIGGSGKIFVFVDGGGWAGDSVGCDIIASGNAFTNGVAVGSSEVQSFEVGGTSAFGAGCQIVHSPDGRGALRVHVGGSCNLGFASGLLWGGGNSGFGVFVELGGTPELIAQGANATKVTGGLGDIGFALPLSGLLVALARAFNDTTGLYTANIATTYANFQTSIAGGGFGGQMHRLDAASSVVGV